MRVDPDTLMLSESPDAMLLLTPGRKFAHWGQGPGPIFGLMRADAIERRLEDLFVPADRIGEGPLG